MKKRLFSLFFSTIFLAFPFHSIALSSPSVSEDSSAIHAQEDTTAFNHFQKLHFYFDEEEYATIDSLTELNEATEYIAQKAQATANTRNITTTAGTDELRLTVCFASNIKETPQYKEFLAEQKTLDSIEEVRDFRHRLNSFSKAYHEELFAQNYSTLTSLEYSDLKMIDYSPFVVMKASATNLDSASLNALASNESVESICVAEAETAEIATEYTAESAPNPSRDCSTLDEALESINATQTITIGTYTGSGIRIGVQDEDIANLEAYYLANVNVTIDPRFASLPRTNPHPTHVTSIIARLAPDADYFVSVLDRSEIGLAWFIEQECDIVNCSWGLFHTEEEISNAVYQDFQQGYRLDADGIYDYQISTHLITVVKSAGNLDSLENPDNKITSPGYAFNAITVGGVRSTSSGWEHNGGSSYVNTYYPRIKPNIAAPCRIYDPYFYGTDDERYCIGTSFSTPLVTGCIALLMEKDSSYCVNPQKVLSLINSTATKTADYFSDLEEYDSHVGAGMINLQRMLLNSNTCSTFENTVSSTSNTVFSQNLYLNAGRELQIALAWLVETSAPEPATNSNGDTVSIVSEITLADYDIYLVNTSGGSVDVASSALSFSNVELIRFSSELSGFYRIEVYQIGDSTLAGHTDELTLSYNIS